MDKELEKKLEEASVKWLEENRDKTTVLCFNIETLAHFCLNAGEELGFKEAIKVAKEWLKEYTLTNHTPNGNICTVFFETKKELLTNFEADMNKLLEGRK